MSDHEFWNPEIPLKRLDTRRKPLGDEILEEHERVENGETVVEQTCRRSCGSQYVRVLGPDGFVRSTREVVDCSMRTPLLDKLLEPFGDKDV